ncbi:hypothetical protein [Actinoplanes friuliensis]|uniref:Uncharacterized protein n=1 Tax=Actinoplanes friuliensis DSM 7358 TaxID=1246995 RepID=U5W467_9ACTN|nr:hypothetical protein [Actinoplanes friuliensis]AGZ42706.1 hypothetical protein AFR_22180 [Actinoplanes friuliensis DSM 7358]
MRKLLDEIDGGRFEISVTGLSISPGDGALSCSLLARSSSPAFFSWLRRELRANWEAAAPGDEGAPIEFVRIDDQLIDEWAVQGRLDPSSIMAIDLARKALNRRDDDQRED